MPDDKVIKLGSERDRLTTVRKSKTARTRSKRHRNLTYLSEDEIAKVEAEKKWQNRSRRKGNAVVKKAASKRLPKVAEKRGRQARKGSTRRGARDA